jgi:hypothetical protein
MVQHQLSFAPQLMPSGIECDGGGFVKTIKNVELKMQN